MARKIAEKFKSGSPQDRVKGISFCNIAKKALECGRKDLAIMLLDNEPKAINKVPLLLKMDEHEKALHSATMYGDTDLIYIVLLQLKKTTTVKNISGMFSTFPLARNLYKKYCLQCSLPTLKDMITETDDWSSQAQFALREGFQNVRFKFIYILVI